MEHILADGPRGTRTTIKFANQPPGMFISGEKLTIDAKNFRRIAKLLNAIGDGADAEREEAKLAAWLMVYADQCLNAAGGMAAVSRPYDRDTSSDYADDGRKSSETEIT